MRVMLLESIRIWLSSRYRVLTGHGGGGLDSGAYIVQVSYCDWNQILGTREVDTTI